MSIFELFQTKRRKTIRSYLAEGGGIHHFELKFWHYTAKQFNLYAYRHEQMNELFLNIIMKRTYLFHPLR